MADNQAVNNYLDGMFFLFVEIVAQIVDLAIDAYTYISRATHLLEDILILALTPLYKWRE